jgi:PadR family transcriptional regulator PadR
MRLTVPVAKVLSALLVDPTADRYGLDLMRGTGLPSGTLYPILARLTEAGWIESRWEEIDPMTAGRPARRYYRLTPTGTHLAREALTELRSQTAPSRAAQSPGTVPPGPARPAW